MNSEQRLRIQKNFTLLVTELLVEDIADNLFSKSIIDHDDLQRVRAGVTDSDKARCLVNILLSKEGAYEPFLQELRLSRPDLIKPLTEIDVTKELEKERKERVQFLELIIKKRYRASLGKSVRETYIMKDISFEYWWSRKGCVPQETISDLMEYLQKYFPNVYRERVPTGKAWMYKNIERRQFETSDDEEEDSLGDFGLPLKESLSERKELENNPSPRKEFETHTTIRFQDIKTSFELENVLVPYFESKGIDKRYLKVFHREKIDGMIFANCKEKDLNQLFPDMPFGDKKRILAIMKSIFEEETKQGPFLKIHLNDAKISKDMKRVSGVIEGDENEATVGEICRKFNTPAKAKDVYRRNTLLRTVSNSELSSEPLHMFRHTDDYDEYSLSKWIAIETAIFASACLSDRKDGTIHFGILENPNKADFLEGNVVGLQINKAKFMKIFYGEVQQFFYKDQVDIVLQSVRPPQFVSVHQNEFPNEKSKSLFVIEIDIVLSCGRTKHDIYYIRELKENQETVPRVYTIDKNVPKVLLGDDLKNYMMEKSKNTRVSLRRASRSAEELVKRN